MNFTDYMQAVMSLLSATDIDDTGWGRSYPPHGPNSIFDLPQPTSVARLDAGGLRRQYVCGYITVDFGARSVTFTEANLREGYDERQNVQHPPAGWWDEAMKIKWPLSG